MTRLPVRAGAALAGASLVAGLLTGCVSSAGSASSGSGTGPSSAPSTASAPHVVAAAYTNTVQAGSAKFAVSVSGTGLGSAGVAGQVSASGVVDFTNQDTQLTIALPNGAGQLQARYLGGIIYAELPASLAGLLGGTKPWVSIDASAATQAKLGASLQQLQSSLSSNPVNLLQYLRGTGQQVRELGSATLDGVATTHYAARIDLGKALPGTSAQIRDALQRLDKQLGARDLPAEVWIDRQGRVRKVDLTVNIANPATASSAPSAPATLTEHISVTLSDFGTPVHVVAPPAGQTQDVTGLVTGGN